MNDIQQAEFEILKYFDELTDQYNVKYFLFAGTLLGAVRHEGFIPWDDDIDVGMLRSEFIKFQEEMFKDENIKENIFLQSRKVHSYLATEIAKIRNSSIKIKERVPNTQKGNIGPWVDIFPFDNVPDDDKERKKQFQIVEFCNAWIKRFLLIQVEPEDKGIKKILKFIINKLNRIFYRVNPFLLILFKVRYHWITKYNNQKTEFVGNLGHMYHGNYENYLKTVFLKDDVDDLKPLHFEGNQFPAPANYDRVLTTHYGNYMQIPPESERKVHKIEYMKI